MSPTRRLARPLLAAMFVAGGIDALKDPSAKAPVVDAAGLENPEKLVKLNAAAQLGGGLMLATGRLPRLSSLVLAGSLVPTTLVGHAFWSEGDPDAKSQQQLHFMKNLGLLGGLLLAAADTGGRESVPHAAARITRRTRRKAAKQVERAGKQAERARKDADKRTSKARKSAGSLLPVG